MPSRYLATVRRAMSTPLFLSMSTIASSDSTSAGRLLVDHLADAVAHRFRRMRVAAARGGDRGGEEIAQLEHAARRQHVFVGGDAADRRFVHADRVGDGAQIERPQMPHAMHQEGVLLAHDLGGDLQDRLGALVEAAGQPVGVLQALGEKVLLGLVLRVGPTTWAK